MITLEDKFYTCKYDRAFKEVMLNKGDSEVLKYLLESILKVKINKIEIKNQEMNVRNVHVKRKHVDAILETDIGIIEIEVNSCNKDYIRPRNMAYISDIYASSTMVGETYNEDKKYIQINLTYGLKDSKGTRIYKVQDEEKKLYITNLIIYEINMEYYMKFWYNKERKEIEENKYIIMLDLYPEELKELSKKDKVVSKYMEKLNEVNFDYKFKEYMSAEEDTKKIQNSLLREAKEEGQRDVALEMLKDNVDINMIAKYTGMNVAEINNLK